VFLLVTCISESSVYSLHGEVKQKATIKPINKLVNIKCTLKSDYKLYIDEGKNFSVRKNRPLNFKNKPSRQNWMAGLDSAATSERMVQV
jgi:hypothetical protein